MTGPGDAAAVEAVWNSPNSGPQLNDWFDSDNWLFGPPSSATARATIDNTGFQLNSAVINDPAALANAGSLLVVSNGGALQLNSGSLAAANVTIDNGEITQNGGSFNVQDTLTIDGGNVGYLLGGSGTLTVPALNVINGTFVQSGGSFSGTLTVGADSSLVYGGGQFNGALVNNGVVSLNPDQPTVFGAAISGSGLNIISSSLTFSARNTFAGTTDLRGGTLSVSADGNLGQASAGLRFTGGTLQITGRDFTDLGQHPVSWVTGGGIDIADAGNVFRISQDLGQPAGCVGSDCGVPIGLTKLGSGTLILAGHNTYLGGTFLTAGRLQGNADSLPGDINIAQGAVLAFDQTGAGTYAGALSGAGSLLKQGDGVLTLSGANTHSGGTTLAGGTLSVAADANLGDPVGALNFDGGVLQVTGTALNATPRTINWGAGGGGFDIADAGNTFTVSQGLGGSGGLSKLGGGTLVLSGANTYSGGTQVSGGILQGDSTSLQGDIVNNASLVFKQTATGIYGGSISGSGNVTKLGGGILIFNGTSNYTGQTVVQAGTLQIGDAAHARTRTQEGASILGAVRVDPAGILSGHGTVGGSVNNFGTIAPGGSIGTLNVNGDVVFNRGSIFRVEISPTQASRLNATGQATLGNAAVDVTADPGAYIARSYTILQATGGVAGRFGRLSIPNALSIPSMRLLTPSLSYFADHVDLNLEAVSNPVSVPEHVTRQLVTGLLRTIGGRLDAPLGENCPVNRLGFWARGIGMISSADADGFAPGYSAGTAGSVMGFDLQVSERLSLGVAGFAGHSDVSLQQAARNDGSADSALVSVYGAYTSGAWQFKSVIAYDNDTYTARRAVAATGDARQANSKTYGNRVNDYTELSYSFRSGDLALQPIAGVQLGWMRQNPLSESGGSGDGQNLSVDGRTLYTFDTLVGLRTRYERTLGEGLRAQFELRTLYDHDFGTLQNTVGARLPGGQARLLSTADRPTQRDAGIVGASFALLTASTLNFYLDYNGEIRGGQQAHLISAGVRYAW